MAPPEFVLTKPCPPVPAFKERPILFSAPMVRALLEGSKTQTRRVVKTQPPEGTTSVAVYHHPAARDGRPRFWSLGPDPGTHGAIEYLQPDWALPCPYGAPGDQLWVRETFCPIYPQDPHYNGGRPIEHDYRATYQHGDRMGDLIGLKKKWTPAIHMPRDASRIDLEITGVRVERLQDISEADAQAEGARECDLVSGREVLLAGPSQRGSFVLHYRDIWEQINGTDSWAANPWVWVVAFRRIRPL